MALITYVAPPIEHDFALEWLMWNYDRQTVEDKELVTVDALNYDAGNEWGYTDDALSEASGDIIIPFPPTQWHHPQKGELVLDAINKGASGAYSPLFWFVDVHTLNTKRFYIRNRVPLSMLGHKKGARSGWERLEVPTTMVITTGNSRYNRTIEDPKGIISRKAWGKTISELRKLGKAVVK